MALSAAVQESSYLVQLASSIAISKLSNLVIFQDNMGALDLAKKKRLKHGLNMLTFASIYKNFC